MSITTEAVVDVKAVQKSLNQMTRDERVEFIRASGDPQDRRCRSTCATPIAPTRRRCRRRWPRTCSRSASSRSASAPGPKAARDPAGAAPTSPCVGEARVSKLSTRLEASGLTITKYALTSWTVKCIDRATGEEIYYNTTLPKGVGSWASEEEALKAIGTRIADEFSRDFFLQHAHVAGRARSRSPSTACPTPPSRTCSRASSSACRDVVAVGVAPAGASRASTTCSSPAQGPPAISSQRAC